MEGRAREVAEIKSAGNLIGESASKTPFDKNENCNEHFKRSIFVRIKFCFRTNTNTYDKVTLVCVLTNLHSLC